MVDYESEYCFTAKTDEEYSFVCVTETVPDNVTERDDEWKAFRIQETLDFFLIGILLKISCLMAENNVYMGNELFEVEYCYQIGSDCMGK